jgi:O-antigen ligase
MNLGWGKDNYIAGLLLICGPLLLRGMLQGPWRERVIPAIAFALVTAVQVIIASRAGTLLFVAGTLVQLLYATRRYRVVVSLVAVGVLAALVASPIGMVLLMRMTSLREFASFTIRIWYWREGWRRLVAHLPWGMGLGQGIENPDHLHGTDPHDIWLLVGGDLGLPGVLLWLGVLGAIVGAWLVVWRDRRRRELAFTVLLTFALGNVHSLVEPTFQGVQYQLLFLWIACGSLAYATADAVPATAAQVPREAPVALPAPARA